MIRTKFVRLLKQGDRTLVVAHLADGRWPHSGRHEPAVHRPCCRDPGPARATSPAASPTPGPRFRPLRRSRSRRPAGGTGLPGCAIWKRIGRIERRRTQLIAETPNRTQITRISAVVAQRLPQQLDTLGNGFLVDHGWRPDRLDQLVERHRPSSRPQSSRRKLRSPRTPRTGDTVLTAPPTDARE